MKHLLKQRIPEEDLLGFIHYNPEVIDADRQGKSPYDCSETAVEEIKQNKRKTGSLIQEAPVF